MKTFVVRLFVPAQQEAPPGPALHGFVEEVATGRRASFADDRELVAFLGEPAREQAANPSERSSP